MSNSSRQKMLDAAAALVQAHGFHGAHLGDILKTSGAPRGSLYFHFPEGKAQLVAESTRAAVASVTRQRAELVSSCRTAGELVRRIGESIAEVLDASDFQRSCPISPLVFDGLTGGDSLAALSEEALVEWIGLLRQAFETYGVPARRAASLAMLTQSTFQGAALVALATRRSNVVREVTVQLAAMLDADLPRPARAASRNTVSPGTSSRARRRSKR